MAAFCIYWFDIQLPEAVETAAGLLRQCLHPAFHAGYRHFHGRYEGEKRTENTRLMLFTLLRFAVFPILLALLLKPLLPDFVMRATIVLMAALPVGNLSAMLCNQYGKDSRIIAEGIIVTTLLSVVTITITFLFV